MSTKQDLINLLKDIKDDEEIAWMLWVEEDVKMALEHLKKAGYTKAKKLTKNEIQNVLYYFHGSQDCEYGLTWGGLEQEIQNVLDERKRK